MNHRILSLAVLSVLTTACFGAEREGSQQTVGVVSHVKVLSDRVPDVSSLEAWKKSCLYEGMTDERKALKCWETVVRFQHQDAPPSEYLLNENLVLDPIKMFNVYGYSFCGVAASHVQALARYAGLEARGWTIKAHVVPEVFWDGQWHMLDASLVNYFRKSDGKIAGVEEIVAAVKGWLAQHPELKANDAGLRKFHQDNGWLGWKRGPDLLTRCEFYDWGGWWPAGTHGWYATMQEYDGVVLFPYECGYSQGYQVNIQLRPGERLVRNWSNRGLHVNRGGDPPYALTGKIGEGFLKYASRFGDLAPGRVGNGTLEYNVPLPDPALRWSATKYENLAPAGGNGLFVADAGRPGVLELRMPSSYVYLTGTIEAKAAVGGGKIALLFSDNNGLNWREIGRIARSGPQKLDIGPQVVRRYDYRLRLVLEGQGTGLESLRIVHDVQHSQAALPALAKGANTLRFSVGPQEGTITIEGSVNAENQGKQLLYTDFHPEVKGLGKSLLRVEGKEGQITFPIETPGEMTRLRFGCFYRARDPKDRWELQASFDDGKTFRTVATAEGPKVYGAKWVTVSDVPRGTRKALVRYAGQQRTATCIFDFRIDADYRERFGGFRPVRITYAWEENGQTKTDLHVARSLLETYEIHCAAAPRMKSLSLELTE